MSVIYNCNNKCGTCFDVLINCCLENRQLLQIFKLEYFCLSGTRQLCYPRVTSSRKLSFPDVGILTLRIRIHIL